MQWPYFDRLAPSRTNEERAARAAIQEVWLRVYCSVLSAHVRNDNKADCLPVQIVARSAAQKAVEEFKRTLWDNL